MPESGGCVMHRYMHYSAILVSLFLVSGCGPTWIKDASTQSYIAVKGWTLVLHEDVVIRPGRTRVFFQEGELQGGVNELKPHCELSVRSLSQAPQSITADHFIITRVTGSIDDIVSSDRILLASSGNTLLGLGGDSDGPGRVMHVLKMHLHSEKQPNVTYFSCTGVTDEPYFAQDPTLQDIRVAIGDYISLEATGK